MQSGGSERPWEDHGAPSPTPSLGRLPEIFPPLWSQPLAQQGTGIQRRENYACALLRV